MATDPRVHVDFTAGHVDVAQEPVDLTAPAEFMDTGVLHDERICVECGNDLATEGYKLCSDCLESDDTPAILKEMVP